MVGVEIPKLRDLGTPEPSQNDLVRSSEREVDHLLDTMSNMPRHSATLMAIGKSSFGSDIGSGISTASAGVAICPVVSKNRK